MNATLDMLRATAHRPHDNCEDRFYSCPLSSDGCTNDAATPGKCNCGADAVNAAIDHLVDTLEEEMLALAKLSAPAPQFYSPVHVWGAEKLRDQILSPP